MGDTDSMKNAETPDDDFTVGQVCEMLGVSIRTLHHWDRIGLASPSSRSWAGYRLYSRDDIQRLHQVLIYRETGLPLADIAELLRQPDTSNRTHLEVQRQALMDRISHLQRMVRAVDSLLEKDTMGEKLTPQEVSELLGTDWQAYEDEARENWGDTDAWAQATQRRAAMSKQDIADQKAVADALEKDCAQALRDGIAPGSPQANALAERHKAFLDTCFDTSYGRQVLIARGYTTDERFVQYYDKHEKGLAAWLRQIIEANARAHGVDPDQPQWD